LTAVWSAIKTHQNAGLHHIHNWVSFRGHWGTPPPPPPLAVIWPLGIRVYLRKPTTCKIYWNWDSSAQSKATRQTWSL